MNITVAHDRNLGMTIPLIEAGHRVELYYTEEFTRKLLALNKLDDWLNFHKRITQKYLWENFEVRSEILMSAPFCAPFSNLNRTYVAPGEDDPLKHPKIFDATNMVRVAAGHDHIKIFTMESVARAYPFVAKHLAPILVDRGYHVYLWSFDSYNLGVAQSRPRMFMIATRGIGDALGVINREYILTEEDPEKDSRRVWSKLAGVAISSIHETYPPITEYEKQIWELTPRGHKLRSTFKKAIGDPTHPGPGLGLIRLHPLGVAPVISQSNDLFHPGIPRRLSKEEALALMSYPTHLKVPGSWKNVYRLGNGVPYQVGHALENIVQTLYTQSNRIPMNPGITETNWPIRRSAIMRGDDWPKELEGSKPEWRGKYYSARGWKNDRSRR